MKHIFTFFEKQKDYDENDHIGRTWIRILDFAKETLEKFLNISNFNFQENNKNFSKLCNVIETIDEKDVNADYLISSYKDFIDTMRRLINQQDLARKFSLLNCGLLFDKMGDYRDKFLSENEKKKINDYVEFFDEINILSFFFISPEQIDKIDLMNLKEQNTLSSGIISIQEKKDIIYERHDHPLLNSREVQIYIGNCGNLMLKLIENFKILIFRKLKNDGLECLQKLLAIKKISRHLDLIFEITKERKLIYNDYLYNQQSIDDFLNGTDDEKYFSSLKKMIMEKGIDIEKKDISNKTISLFAFFT